MNDVFISYNHLDIEAANKLYEALNSQGLEVLMDQQEFSVGDPLNQKIKKHISASKYVACLISENSLKSTWVISEIKQCLASEDFHQVDIRLLPIILDDAIFSDKRIDQISEDIARNIKSTEELISKAKLRKTAYDHLSVKQNALIRHINYLPEFVSFLREEKVVLKIEKENFTSSFKKLYSVITGKDKLLNNLPDHKINEVADSNKWRKEILDYIVNGDVHEAAKLAIDFQMQFKEQDEQSIKSAIKLAAKISKELKEWGEIKNAHTKGGLNHKTYQAHKKKHDEKIDTFVDKLLILVNDIDPYSIAA